MSLRGAQQGDAAIFLYKNEIASPSARNDFTVKGVRDTYKTASNHLLVLKSCLRASLKFLLPGGVGKSAPGVNL